MKVLRRSSKPRRFKAGFDQAGDGDSAKFEFEFSGLDLGKLEQIVGQAAKPDRMITNDFEEPIAVFHIFHRASQEGFRESLNRRQRSLELMRDIGHEITARAFQSAQLADVMQNQNGPDY